MVLYDYVIMYSPVSLERVVTLSPTTITLAPELNTMSAASGSPMTCTHLVIPQGQNTEV